MNSRVFGQSLLAGVLEFSGAGLTLVSVGAPTPTSLTPVASRPCLVMRSGPGFSIASPGQERAIGADLFQQPSADELIHGLPNRFARNVCRQVKSAIIASRSRGQNDELGIGEKCPRRLASMTCSGNGAFAPPLT